MVIKNPLETNAINIVIFRLTTTI